MADHIWTIICSKQLIDPESKVISLIDVAEKLNLGGSDVSEVLDQAKSQGGKGIRFDVKMQVVTWWIRSDPEVPETAPLRLSLVSPSGEALYRQEFDVDLQLEAVSRRTVIRFDKLWITDVGRYWFVMEKQNPSRSKKHTWTVAARVPLELTQEQPAQEPSA